VCAGWKWAWSIAGVKCLGVVWGKVWGMIPFVFGIDVRRRKMFAFVPEPCRKTILGLSMVIVSGLKNGVVAARSD
jgi:hypothetical protein